MTRKDQNKILDYKIESNVNQYKIDRLNAEISAFSEGNLDKYEFLTQKVLKYKPNALDKAKFEFSPLGKAFSQGLDKTVKGYQEEGVIKLLKDIRDGLAGKNIGNIRNNGNNGNDDDDDDGDDDRSNKPDNGDDDRSNEPDDDRPNKPDNKYSDEYMLGLSELLGDLKHGKNEGETKIEPKEDKLDTIF